jgi:hypothetical protein
MTDEKSGVELLQSEAAFRNLIPHEACLCGKLLQLPHHSERAYSGVVNYTLTLCPDCRGNFRDYCRIVCLRCRSLQGFLQPYRAPDGFVYEPRGHYHIHGCPRCDASITATPVLEHERFRAARVGPSKPDADLVQEIEQKTLRGLAEIAKLQESLKL